MYLVFNVIFLRFFITSNGFFSNAFIRKGVLRPLFTFLIFFFLLLYFSIYHCISKRDLVTNSIWMRECEMFYGDVLALDAYNQDWNSRFSHRDLQKTVKHGKKGKENQMFYDLVSRVFYCTTSSLLIPLFTVGGL